MEEHGEGVTLSMCKEKTEMEGLLQKWSLRIMWHSGILFMKRGAISKLQI